MFHYVVFSTLLIGGVLGCFDNECIPIEDGVCDCILSPNVTENRHVRSVDNTSSIRFEPIPETIIVELKTFFKPSDSKLPGAEVNQFSSKFTNRLYLVPIDSADLSIDRYNNYISPAAVDALKSSKSITIFKDFSPQSSTAETVARLDYEDKSVIAFVVSTFSFGLSDIQNSHQNCHKSGWFWNKKTKCSTSYSYSKRPLTPALSNAIKAHMESEALKAFVDKYQSMKLK